DPHLSRPGLTQAHRDVPAAGGAPLDEPLEVALRLQRPQRGAARQRSETVRRLRPFALRRERTRRPAGVAMRALKPCVLARLRRFGWYVRFISAPRTARRQARLPVRRLRPVAWCALPFPTGARPCRRS